MTAVERDGSFVEVNSDRVHAYFDAVDREDFASVARLFADAAEIRAPGVPTRRGHDEIEAYLRAALRPYADHMDEPTRIIGSGETIVAEIRFCGVLEDGARVTFDAVDIFDFGPDGLILRLSSWYDSHAVRKTLRGGHAITERSAAPLSEPF